MKQVDVVKRNNKVAAFNAAINAILADKQTIHDVLYEVVSAAIDYQLRFAFKRQRERAIATALVVTQVTTKNIVKQLESLSDFPMRSGIKLRDALKADVEETATFYITSGATHIRRGLWLQAVAKKLPNRHTPVGQVLSSNNLSVLLDAATHHVQKIGLIP
jgi:hypothetical protein